MKFSAAGDFFGVFILLAPHCPQPGTASRSEADHVPLDTGAGWNIHRLNYWCNNIILVRGSVGCKHLTVGGLFVRWILGPDGRGSCNARRPRDGLRRYCSSTLARENSIRRIIIKLKNTASLVPNPNAEKYEILNLLKIRNHKI